MAVSEGYDNDSSKLYFITCLTCFKSEYAKCCKIKNVKFLMAAYQSDINPSGLT